MMFGGPVERPKLPEKKPRKKPEFQDSFMPSIEPGHYGHCGRSPNTNYSTRLLHFHQRNDALYNDKLEKQREQVQKESFMQKFESHAGSRRFKRELNIRLQEKMSSYDDEIEEKRERMRKLMAEDEREFYFETVDSLQKGKQLKLNEMKEKIAKLRSERESERLKLVEEKRIQQYANRCEELRPIMAKKHLLESKVIQLQQIRENEARRQADKELEALWNHAMLKELEFRMEREQQEALADYLKRLRQREDLEKQIKGKMQAKEEAKKVKEEDRLEIERMAQELKKQELENLKSIRKKNRETAEELKKQIEFQRQLIAERTKAEQDLENAYTKLSYAQYEREKAAIVDSRSQANREMKQYIKYLKEIEENAKIEEAKLDKLLEEYRMAIEKKQDEAKCKILAAKQKLLEDTIKGVAEQREHKLKLAQEELREKEAANELMRLCYETNQKLLEEYKRSQACVQQKYKEDLDKQIAYNKLLKERENAELERMLELGRKEEEEYKRKVQEIIDSSFSSGEKHPFRRVLEQYDCKCPNTPIIRPKY